jgi:hypothetical protein
MVAIYQKSLKKTCKLVRNSAKRLKISYALKGYSNEFLRFNTNFSQPTGLLKTRAKKPNDLLHA